MDIQSIEQALPEQWRGFFRVLSLPIAWLFPLQAKLLTWAWGSDSAVVDAVKRMFLLPPAVTIVVGLWCTMLATYTLIFRSGRGKFVGTMVVLWWDVARGCWLFWGGIGRFVFVLAGAIWGGLLLGVQTLIELIREMIDLPFHLTGNIGRTLRQTGVPWIAVAMTILWAALEAVIFSYILTPTIGDIVSDLVGSDAHRYLTPFLFMMLWVMISGSLACMYVLVDAIKRRDIPQILQMMVVEFFVMFMEVMFFYRELIDALTPWIAQQTGVQMGLVPVILFASFGWMGVRGMVWFLFARFGTPTLLAIISRERLPEEAAIAASPEMSEQRWVLVMTKLKKDQAWFNERGESLLEAAILPPFQLLATSFNFVVTLFLSEPLFSLPFKNLSEVVETKALLGRLGGKESAS